MYGKDTEALVADERRMLGITRTPTESFHALATAVTLHVSDPSPDTCRLMLEVMRAETGNVAAWLRDNAAPLEAPAPTKTKGARFKDEDGNIIERATQDWSSIAPDEPE